MPYETIYLKSQDEHTVASIRGPVPVIPNAKWYEGYQIIERPEFLRLRRRIRVAHVESSASAPEQRDQAERGNGADPEDGASEASVCRFCGTVLPPIEDIYTEDGTPHCPECDEPI